MKKLMCIILSICLTTTTLVFTIAFCSSAASSESEIIAKVSTVIEEFYYSKDINGNVAYTDILNNDIEMYLFNKIETHQYVTSLYNTEKENYDVEVILLDAVEEDNILYLDFQVISTFNYVGMDVDTTVSEEVYIVYDISNDEIYDFYTPLNYYDAAIRGNNDFSTELNMSDSIGFTLTDDCIEHQNSIIDDIYSVYITETTVDINADRESTVQPLASTINRQSTVNWARTNYNKTQPSSGNGTVPYYDFSEISGSYDCTNFVSHALIAGGAVVNDTGGSGVSSTGWYYRSLSNRSSSWSGVNQLYTYMSTSTTSGKATAINNIFQFTQNGAYWGIGSVLQFNLDSDSSYEHSTIITVKNTSSDGTRSYALVTGRTSDTSYNNNQDASEIAPTYIKRVLNVYNY